MKAILNNKIYELYSIKENSKIKVKAISEDGKIMDINNIIK